MNISRSISVRANQRTNPVPIDPFFTSAVKITAWTPKRKVNGGVSPATGERFSRIPERGKRLDWYRNVYLWSSYWRGVRKRKLAVSPKCEDCGSGGRVDVHHVIYGDLWNVPLDYVRTLCRDCHDRRHVNRRRAERAGKRLSIKNAMTPMDDIKQRRRRFELIRRTTQREENIRAHNARVRKTQDKAKARRRRRVWCSVEQWQSTRI